MYTPTHSYVVTCAVSSRVKREIFPPQDATSSSAGDIGLHVAVKTYSGNHGTRLPVLHQTWLPAAPSYVLYSDVTGVVLHVRCCGVTGLVQFTSVVVWCYRCGAVTGVVLEVWWCGAVVLQGSLLHSTHSPLF